MDDRRLQSPGESPGLSLIETNGLSLAIIEASPVPLAINDENGNITFLNHAFIQTIGYTLDDIPTLADWWPNAYPDPQYRQWVADTWQKNLGEAKISGLPFAQMEIKIHCKDHVTRTFMVSAASLGEGFSGNHLVILYDITDRKQAELALMASTETLKEAQQIAHIGNWTLDLVSNQLTWSDEIFNIFEIDRNQFGATYDAFLNAIHPDDRESVNKAYTDSLITRMPYEITHRLLMSDGRIKWVLEKCRSTFDSKGAPLQSRGMVQDITNSKQAELALIEAVSEAERANKAKSLFLSSMSHELRTPLNAILGFSQIMKLDPTFPDEHKQNLDEVLMAGHLLLDLINGVLDLTKIEAGHIDLNMEAVNIHNLIDECLTMVGSIANLRGIKFIHTVMNETAVRADRMRLKQALLNLLSNAIKYNRENGSVHLNVLRQDPNRVRILVIDTGTGIPAARLAELFQPFSRLGAENGNIEGTGIGLTITQRVIEAMDGTVGVESEYGVGSTFWIDMPEIK